MSSIVDRSTKSQVKLVDCKDRVAHVTIDCPPLNLINTALLGSLAEMLSELAADPQVRAIVLDTANGVPPFAADAGELTALTTWQQTFEMLKRGQEALTTIEFLPRPVIMAIYDGMCIGGDSSWRFPAICVSRAHRPGLPYRRRPPGRIPAGATPNVSQGFLAGRRALS